MQNINKHKIKKRECARNIYNFLTEVQLQMEEFRRISNRRGQNHRAMILRIEEFISNTRGMRDICFLVSIGKYIKHTRRSSHEEYELRIAQLIRDNWALESQIEKYKNSLNITDIREGKKDNSTHDLMHNIGEL